MKKINFSILKKIISVFFLVLLPKYVNAAQNNLYDLKYEAEQISNKVAGSNIWDAIGFTAIVIGLFVLLIVVLFIFFMILKSD